MKSLFIAIVLSVLTALCANAQYIPEQNGDYSIVSRSNHANILTLNGETLSYGKTVSYINSHLGADEAEAWDKASKQLQTGRRLLIGFGATTAAGTLMIAGSFMYEHYIRKSEHTCTDGFYASLLGITGGCVAIIGVAGLLGGTGVYCVAQKRLNNITDDLNAASSGHTSCWSFNIGMQRYGVGLAIDF